MPGAPPRPRGSTSPRRDGFDLVGGCFGRTARDLRKVLQQAGERLDSSLPHRVERALQVGAALRADPLEYAASGRGERDPHDPAAACVTAAPHVAPALQPVGESSNGGGAYAQLAGELAERLAVAVVELEQQPNPASA